MKFSVFYHHVMEAAQQEGTSIEAVLGTIRQAGITALEMSLNDVDAALPVLNKCGVLVSCICGTFAWQNGGDYADGIRLVDTAMKAGASSILVVPGFFSDEEGAQVRALTGDPSGLSAFMDGNETVHRIVEGLKKTVAYAMKVSGGKLSVTLQDYDLISSPCATAGGLAYFMEQVPGLTFTLDTGNFAYSNEDVLAAADRFSGRIAHVHLKDRSEEPTVLAQGLKFNRGLAPSPVGSGYLPIREIIAKTEAAGFDEWYVIEHYGAPQQLRFMLESIGNLTALA